MDTQQEKVLRIANERLEHSRQSGKLYEVNSGRFVLSYIWEDDSLEGEGKHVECRGIRVSGTDENLLPSFEGMGMEDAIHEEIYTQLKKK